MPRDDDWEDDDRPRRRRERERDDRDDEEDDYDRPRRRGGAGEKSGAVTSVGVLNIVLGSLITILGLCLMLGGLFAAGAGADVNRFNVNPPGAPNPGGMMAFLGGMVILFSVVFLLFGVGMILAGVGILNRRNWARILTFVLAAFMAIFALLHLVSLFQTISAPPVPGKTTAILVALLMVMIEIAYVVLSYTVLLNSRYAGEFR